MSHFANLTTRPSMQTDGDHYSFLSKEESSPSIIGAIMLRPLQVICAIALTELCQLHTYASQPAPSRRWWISSYPTQTQIKNFSLIPKFYSPAMNTSLTRSVIPNVNSNRYIVSHGVLYSLSTDTLPLPHSPLLLPIDSTSKQSNQFSLLMFDVGFQFSK